MSELYENIAMLLNEKGVSGYKMCKDIGIRPSILSDLKSGRKQGLHTETAEKIANYFDVSVNYLVNAKEWEKTIEEQRQGGAESFENRMINLGFVRNENYRKDGYVWNRSKPANEKSSTPSGAELEFTDMELLNAYKSADDVTKELIRRALGLK